MEEQFFYHVISDVPKKAGEHLILDEDHPNGVYKRVQEQMETVTDIANNPEKYKEAEQWGDYFAKLGRPTYGIAKIRVNGKVYEGDAYKCFDGGPDEEENLKMAEIYWQNGENKDGHRSIVEILADGDIEFVEIVKEINANI